MNVDAVDRGVEWALMVIAAAILVADLNHVLEYLFITLAVVVLTRQIVSRDRRLVWTSLDLPILVFLGWILISIISATDPLYSFGEMAKIACPCVDVFSPGELHFRGRAGQANPRGIRRWGASDECLRYRGVFSRRRITCGAMA